MADKLRKAAVRGIFYPQKCNDIKNVIHTFNREFDSVKIDEKILSTIPNAIIVPHAGYVYSGFTANFAYRFLGKSSAKRFIVIGPSHHYYFKGISGAVYKSFKTPCSAMAIDMPYLEALSKEFHIGFDAKAHRNEHSTEVQMPFIQYYFPDKKIIELVYGDFEGSELAKIIVALLSNSDNAVIISSDLSHFYPLKEAKKHDIICLKAIEQIDAAMLEKGCEACGIIGIKAMLIAARYLDLHAVLLDYKTSADANHDESSVVGYLSAMFY